MVAGGIPGVQVLLDDGTGTFPYDISAKTRIGYDLNRGRQDEQSSVTPGAIRSLVLDNTDGRFTLNSTVIATPSPIRPDNRIRVKVAVGNLLSNPSIETNTAGWANTVNCSIARTTAQAFSGAASLQLTATALGDMQSNFAGVPVAAGAAYTFSAYYRTATTPRTCYAYIEWRDAGGVFISGGSASAADTSSGWTRISFTMTAPANAVTATVGVGCFGAAAGEVHYADAMMLQQSSALNAYVEGGVLLNRFTGYVQEWPTDWPDGSDLLCEVTLAATDAQARAERRELLSVVEEEYLLDNEVMYYILGEPANSTSAIDSSGSQSPALAIAGSGANVVFGTATGPGTDGYTAAQFAGGKYLYLPNVGITVDPAVGWWVECFFVTTGSAAQTFFAGDVAVSSGLESFNLSLLGGGGVNADGANVPSLFAITPAVNDGLLHHALAFYSNAGGVLYVDGVQVATGGATGGAQVLKTLSIGANTVGFSTTLLTGTVAHAAIGIGTMTAARAAAHAGAGLTGFAGESGAARLTRTAAYAKVPVGTLDASLTNVPFKDITGTTAADQMRAVADAELGIVYIDGAGNLTFHNRARTQGGVAPDITLTADQLDPGTMVPIDMQGVVNYMAVTASATGLEQVVRNTVSEKGDGTVTNPGHGRYPSSKAYLVTTDAEALDRGNWTVANHAEPLPRIPVLKIDLLTLDPATQAALLAAEADTWIRITGLPAQTPGGTTADVLVQGFTEHMAPDAWDITFNVVARSMYQAWVLGDSTYGVLGSTTRLGV